MLTTRFDTRIHAQRRVGSGISLSSGTFCTTKDARVIRFDQEPRVHEHEVLDEPERYQREYRPRRVYNRSWRAGAPQDPLCGSPQTVYRESALPRSSALG